MTADPDPHRRHAILHRLTKTAALERAAAAETDRLIKWAHREGFTDQQVADAAGLTRDAIRMRRRRDGLRKPNHPHRNRPQPRAANTIPHGPAHSRAGRA